MNQNPKEALILLSGGLDSATCMAMAQANGWLLHALSFNYGQKHLAELEAAKRLAREYNLLSHRIIALDLGQLGGSALTDINIPVPETPQEGIPNTYVPARNTLFLSYALACAEALGVYDIFIGVNAIDYSGYPDCRPEFIKAFSHLANLATKAGVEGRRLVIHTPLIHLKKSDIIKKGHSLGLDYRKTISCYQSDTQGLACGRCDSCRFRKQGFLEADLPDQTLYCFPQKLNRDIES